ncbi:response regulator [Geothrix sp. 21YS21S-2]|uniref:response regulator n=1 Tax=Geothrix sp. 21YS21S-2 TaxID=3068893 RepID=UPI0027B9A1B1|nr:response regulator [Geothrix sp. 21YS21S-2]
MPKTIMIVDDASTLRALLRLVLTRAGFDVVEARDGREALDCLHDRQVDLLLCDINMPNMDGFSLLKALRGNARHARTPVVMLTSESGADMKRLGRALGAQAWVVKPFHPDQVLSLVARLLPP